VTKILWDLHSKKEGSPTVVAFSHWPMPYGIGPTVLLPTMFSRQAFVRKTFPAAPSLYCTNICWVNGLWLPWNSNNTNFWTLCLFIHIKFYKEDPRGNKGLCDMNFWTLLLYIRIYTPHSPSLEFPVPPYGPLQASAPTYCMTYNPMDNMTYDLWLKVLPGHWYGPKSAYRPTTVPCWCTTYNLQFYCRPMAGPLPLYFGSGLWWRLGLMAAPGTLRYNTMPLWPTALCTTLCPGPLPHVLTGLGPYSITALRPYHLFGLQQAYDFTGLQPLFELQHAYNLTLLLRPYKPRGLPTTPWPNL